MTKTGPTPAEKIETGTLCVYGCGQTAQYRNKAGTFMCEPFPSKCIVNRRKNSATLKNAYKTGKRVSAKKRYQHLPEETKNKMNHRKGKRFANFSYGGQGQHKNALILERGHVCEQCHLTEWQSQPITLELEHTDGDKKNNTRNNLKLLCPNCHSLTPTWRRGRTPGRKLRKYPEEVILNAVRECENIHQVLERLDLRYGSVKGIIDVMIKREVNFLTGH